MRPGLSSVDLIAERAVLGVSLAERVECMLGKALAKLRLMGADKAANVAIITAFSALPIFGIMGLAVDYALAVSTKSRLDAAADSAVIAATTKAKAVFFAGGSLSSAISQGQVQGLAAFRANAGLMSLADLPTPTVTIVSNSQNLTATVSYTTPAHNQFGKLFSTASTTVKGSSSSATVLTPYYQFIFVVDVSGSMAIGATTNDIAGLNADPNIQCSVACHDPYHNRLSNDPRAAAKADGWKLKIDYVNQAIQTFISDLGTKTASIPGVYSVGLDTFATSFTVLQTPTTSLNAAAKQAAQIDIEPMQPLSVSQGYTRTTSSLSAALAQVKNIGDGTSQTSQVTYFIFLSDGVEDIEGSGSYGRGTDVSYTSACSTIKSAGAKIISIYAAYPFMSDSQYTEFVQPLAAKLVPSMQSCASDPTMAYQATDGPGINTAVQSALQQILQGMTRLTQ